MARIREEKLSHLAATRCILGSIERRLMVFVVNIKLSAVAKE